MEPIEIDCDGREIDIVLKIKGVKKPFKLKEMDGKKRDALLNDALNKSDKTTGLTKDFTGSRSALIAMCLWDVEKVMFVTDTEIQTFPTTVQLRLYDECEKLNSLQKEGADKEKKESSSEEKSSDG